MNPNSERRIGAGQHLLLYDGVCGLCNRVTRFVLRWDRRAVFDFASLQSGTGRSYLERWGRQPAELNTVYVVADYGTGNPRVLSRSRAALFVLTALGGWWRVFAIFKPLPTGMLDVLYDAVARNRYRLFGRYDTCPLPAAAHRTRFIDI